jgi:hypothetical protein
MRIPGVTRRRRLVRLLATAGIAVAAAGLNTASVRASDRPQKRAPDGLDVQPFPGTPDASPRTQISFPSVAPWQIKAVSVRGSRSGPHGGRLIALPAGHGTAFIPRHPFTDGDDVSVHLTLSSPAAATASGESNGVQIGFAFKVSAPTKIDHPAPGKHSYAASTRDFIRDSNGFTETFYSQNSFHPPIVSVSGKDPDPHAGDIFADAENSIQPGPLIFDAQGRLIYFQPLKQSAAFNVQVQRYQGQTVLTYWQGYVQQGVGIGTDVILNHNYQQLVRLGAGNGYSADLHEFAITPQGDAFITAYAPVKADLSSIGGPRNGTLLDSIVQELDIATGRVLWEWHAYGHVHVSETYAGKASRQPFDFFHVNSIQQLPGGKLLVSGRNTWGLYEIDMRTGRIVLVIGGKHSSLRMGPGTQFEWQHNARVQPDGTITLFDNASNVATRNERYSRALRISLDLRSRRATLVHAYSSNPGLSSGSQGSVQPLSDGNTFVGWGAEPYFTEYGRKGRQLFTMHFNLPLQSYRGYRFGWWGQPTTPPSIAAKATPKASNVYASWNGATTVASWRVLAGPSATSLTAIGQFPRTSFETAMSVANSGPYFQVQAIDGAGNVLGTSAAVSG